MKKGSILFFIIIVFGIINAQNVLQQFMYTDNLELETPLYLPDVKTPVPDSSLIEICIPFKDNIKDYQNDLHGEQINNNLVTDYTNGGMYPEIGIGFFLTSKYFIWKEIAIENPEPTANCGDQIYLRLYNAKTIEEATFYRHSRFIVGPLSGTPPSELEIETWEDWQEIEFDDDIKEKDKKY